jgi:hypothetical protein
MTREELVQKEQELCRAFATGYDLSFLSTPTHSRADALFYRKATGAVFAIGEAKYRPTYASTEVNGTAMLSYCKIVDIVQGARLFAVPSVLIMGFNDGISYWWKLSDTGGHIVAPVNLRMGGAPKSYGSDEMKTETQAFLRLSDGTLLGGGQ